MSQTVVPVETLTFEEYRFYQGEPDILYELYRGKLLPMATPTALHTRICDFLVYHLRRYFAKQNLTLIATTPVGVRTEVDSSRIPDVVVCNSALWEKVCARAGSGILDFGESPILVIEVTSENWREDYIRKRAEYALLNIPEYWIVNSKKQHVLLLSHPEGENGYERVDFSLGQEFSSVQFPELVLSVNTILSPPVVEDLIRQEQAQQRELEQQLDDERRRADNEQQRADNEQQRAERLAARLRELGENPDAM